MRRAIPNNADIRRQYEEDYETRLCIIKDIEQYLEYALAGVPSHLTIKGRVKSFDSFYKKYLRYLKENGGQARIPDEIGVRIVCPFLEDIDHVENIIREKFAILEIEEKGGDYTYKEFGYESRHLLVVIPESIGSRYYKKNGEDFTREIAEIQLRTILQDAWAEVEHELVYKARFAPLDTSMRRKLAAINASFSLADTVFQEFRSYQKQLNRQLEKRRMNFHRQIEKNIGDLAFDDINEDEKVPYPLNAPREVNSSSLDDLLLNALYAHNKGLFKEAEMFYSRILELNPNGKLQALVHKHRGMASFAQSNYHEAINDFSLALTLDNTSYQTAYYLGVVHACLREYAESLEAFSVSISINPFQKYCFFRRAQSYFHINDYPQALSDCEAAVSLDGDFKQAKHLKSLLLKKLKM